MTRVSSPARVRIPRNRRGLALLAALWLVVIISTAGLQFATTARERRQLGMTSADRSRDVAALEGALAHIHASLERDTPASLSGQSRARTTRRLAMNTDPWQQLSSSLSAPIFVGNSQVTARVTDLGTVVNINLASEIELAALFSSVLGGDEVATSLAQAVLDWRDADTVARPAGAEAERYARMGLPVRPANGRLQSVDDLQDVMGMTPERLVQLRPYLTVDGDIRRINVNAAPAAVLRTLPGMTEPLLSTILALRSRARRVESIPALLSAVRNTGTASRDEREAMGRQLVDAVSLEVQDVAIELSVGAPQSQPMRLTAVLHRNSDGSVRVGVRRW